MYNVYIKKIKTYRKSNKCKKYTKAAKFKTKHQIM